MATTNWMQKRPHGVHEYPIPTISVTGQWINTFYIKDFELSLTESANVHGLSYRQHIMAK
jgi:hypothetical protein